MPRGNGSGPMGMGPMTGRGAGFCAGYGMPGFMNPAAGRGMGRGRGFGMGWRNGRRNAQSPSAPYASPYPPAVTPRSELEMLKDEAEYFTRTLEGIRRRIDQLEKDTGQ
jgi:hypothetical protein